MYDYLLCLEVFLMKNLGLNEIREKYLSFFESKGHLRLPSFPLVPNNDKSLLLINAGMAPLKSYFTGQEKPPAKRVTTCQKCIRTPDIERVGKTARHGTFFEMLGNFSFGDYFKDEAILWAWEFVIQELQLPIDKLWVTIYQDDDEAFEIWTKKVGISPDRVVRMGKEDNFWEIGTGPCGPCSEIFFDMGEDVGCKGPDCKLGCDCDRFVEFWNLVFTQFDKDEEGNYNRLSNPNIDTGMGLERMAAIMQNVNSLFEVDTVKNIMLRVSEEAGVKYGKNSETDISLRVITDHIRSTTFMISDNIAPSNEGRGYVLRRLLRRAARHGKLLGINHAFLHEIADTVIDESKEAYPELVQKRDYIKKIIKREEERFDQTIDMGLQILNGYISDMKSKGETVLDGKHAFKLYDTYGFPIDLTIEILAENKMQADEEGFEKEMEKQREMAREARAAGEIGFGKNAISLGEDIKTEFVGYDNLTGEGKVLAILVNGEFKEEAHDGEDAVLVFDKTVFYGESGGQKGDTGKIIGDGLVARVYDAKKLHDENIIHFVTIVEGSISVGDTLSLKVDEDERRAAQRNHSATHLLHKALKEVLGDHVEQAGSFVASDRFRFDFSHYEALTPQQIQEIENVVNREILSAKSITKTEMPQAKAKEMGAAALFGEKYGEIVRVVQMGDFSIELCGGCHTNNTSEIGLFKILSESSVAAGIRRIEGVTGEGVLKYIKEKDELIEKTSKALKANPAELEARAKSFVRDLNLSNKELEKLKMKIANSMVSNMLSGFKEVSGVKIVTHMLDNLSVDEMRNIGDAIKNKIDPGLVVMASRFEGKITFIAMATEKAVKMGIHAGNIIREVAKIAGGGGGGKADTAQAGGKLPEKIDDALAIVDNLVKEQVK